MGSGYVPSTIQLDVIGTGRFSGKLTTTSAEDDFGGSSNFTRRNSNNIWFYTSGNAQGGIGAATGTNYRSVIISGVNSGYTANAFYIGTALAAPYLDQTFVKLGSTPTTYTVSASFEIESTNRGFLPPRMTTTQKNAIVSPVAGLIVYDTTLNKLALYTTAWETITSV